MNFAFLFYFSNFVNYSFFLKAFFTSKFYKTRNKFIKNNFFSRNNRKIVFSLFVLSLFRSKYGESYFLLLRRGEIVKFVFFYFKYKHRFHLNSFFNF